MGKHRNGMLSMEENIKIDTLWKDPCKRSILSFSSCCLNNLLFDGSVVVKKLNIFWKLNLHSLGYLYFACKKNVIAKNEDANIPWSPKAKTITDMRKRDCNLALRDTQLGKLAEGNIG